MGPIKAAGAEAVAGVQCLLGGVVTGGEPLAESDDVAAHVARRIAMVGDHALKGSCPLYLETVPWKLSFLASSVVIQLGPTQVLVTAAHVFDEVKGRGIYAGGENQLVEIFGGWVLTSAPVGGREKDPIDLALLRLSETVERQLAVTPITLEQIDPHHVPDRTRYSGTYYLAVGFPEGKQSTWLKNGGLHPKQIYLTGHPAIPAEQLGSVFRTPANLTMEFDKESMVAPNGTSIVAPNPTGMSGGGLWNVPGLVAPVMGTPKLVGVSIVWHHTSKLIVATRFDHVFGAVQQRMPDLAQYLPRPTDVT